MIVSKLQGGLGNQLFQWAVTKSYSVKYNCKYKFDISFYSSQTFRELLVCEFQNLKFETVIQSDIDRQVIRITDDFNFKDLPYDINKIIFLDGFWQSEKYFIESKDIIKSELSFDDEFYKKLKYFDVITEDTTSIHLRRTDYTSSNGYHPVQSIEYFQQGLDIIKDYEKILVFSDDIQWCKENLKFKNMIFIEGNSAIEDMLTMSLCKNNIISNSSFSWWAAWINNNSNKKIIAPINWFGDHVNINSSDIVPNEWIKI